MEEILKITNLSLPFVFKDLSMTINKNTFITVSGPNKCGKTTLIKVLSRQLDSSCKIEFFSKDLSLYKLSELSELVEYIITDQLEFNFQTLEEEIEYILYKKSVNKKDSLYKEILKILKLTKLQKKKLSDLNKTEKIKVKLALSLIKQPKLLLLDDIFKELSQTEKKDLINILKQYQKQKDITIIMTISDLEDSLESDYLYIMNNNIVLEGKPLDVLQNDNIINKLGLDLPFIIDLSVKLRDYELITEIELDPDRLVNKLWN